jgi:hypothetical protein
MTSDALASSNHSASPALRSDEPEWPGVADAQVLRAQLLDRLSQYANAGTRRTHA